MTNKVCLRCFDLPSFGVYTVNTAQSNNCCQSINDQNALLIKSPSRLREVVVSEGLTTFGLLCFQRTGLPEHVLANPTCLS